MSPRAGDSRAETQTHTETQSAKIGQKVANPTIYIFYHSIVFFVGNFRGKGGMKRKYLPVIQEHLNKKNAGLNKDDNIK